MRDEMLLGEILFSFNSRLPIHWTREEERFRYRNEEFRKKYIVNIQFTPVLPHLLVHEEYVNKGIRFGRDIEHNIVRELSALYLEGNPTYAVSVLHDTILTIYFIDDQTIWNNPNIHLWNMVPLENIFLQVDALVLHCSYLMYEGKAILFSAPSGTGKTTQAKLWEKLSSARIINGDKAIVQKKDDTWYACGFPFHGSAAECFNEHYPIEAVVVVRQNEKDFIERLKSIKQFQYVYSEITVNTWNQSAVAKAVDLVNDLISNTEIICQKCTMKDNAFYTLFQYLKEKKDGII